MSFATALAKHSQVTGGVTCTVKVWRDELAPADQADFDESLGSTLATSAICRAMKELGYRHGDGSVARHRRKDCRCELR